MRLVRYTYPSFQRSPWTGFENEIDRVFGSALAEFTATPTGRFPVDLYEDKTNAYVRAELPGVNRDDISVEFADSTLTIAATRKTPATENQAEQSASFTRSVSVHDDVQADKISAAYENGVLTVTLPKREVVEPKKITVAVN